MNRPVFWNTQLASVAAILAVVVGVMVLVGWAFDIAVLKSVLPGLVAMKANTAVCFILMGVALWLTARPPAIFNPQFATFFTRFCGLLPGLIGLLTLGEYLFSWNPGLDQWLIREPPGAIDTTDLGRMAPETALCFALLAAALWITGSSRQTIRRARWTILAPVSFGLLVTALALAAMLSYPTPSLGAYGWFGLTIMAMHTAIVFAMLGMAIIAISWRKDILQWALDRNTTAAFVCGMAVLVLIGLNINRSQFWLGETNRKIAYSEEAQGYIENILIEIVDAQAHTRGYIITGDEQFKAHYLEAKTNSNVNLEALRKFIADNPHQQQLFARIEAQAKAQLQWFQQVIDARQTRMADATRSDMIRHGEGMLDNFRITYAQLKSEHQQRIDELKQESKRVARHSYIIIVIGTLASLLIFMAVIFRLNFAVNERKQKEGALQESEERFRKITESAQDAIIMMGPDQNISFWNAAAERIFGYTAAEAIGRELHALIVPIPAHAKFSQAFPHFQETGDGPIIGKVRELIALRKSGEEFPVELSVSATQFGGQWHAIGIVRDITERKRTEESLRKLSLAVEQSPNAIIIADLDANIEYVNAAFVKITGYSLAEVIGQNPRILQSGKTPKTTYDDLWAHLTRGEAWSGEIINRRKDGSEYVESMLISPVRQADGCVTNYLAIKEDITKRKRVEETLQLRTAELEESQRIGQIGSWVLTPATGVITWSEELNRILARDRALPAPNFEAVKQFYTPESWQRLSAAFTNTIETGAPCNLELEMIRADGVTCWTITRGEALLGADGSVVKLRGTVHDITEHKHAEDALRKSEERYRQIVETAQEGIWIIDQNNITTFANNRVAALLGYTVEEMLGMPLFDFMDEAGKAISTKNVERRRQGLNEQHDFKLQRKDGTDLWVIMETSPMVNGGGEYMGALAMITDITARVQAEAKLAEQLEELRRWHDITSGREGRILDLKHEVNELLAQAGQPPRYPSAE